MFAGLVIQAQGYLEKSRPSRPKGLSADLSPSDKVENSKYIGIDSIKLIDGGLKINGVRQKNITNIICYLFGPYDPKGVYGGMEFKLEGQEREFQIYYSLNLKEQDVLQGTYELVMNVNQTASDPDIGRLSVIAYLDLKNNKVKKIEYYEKN